MQLIVADVLNTIIPPAGFLAAIITPQGEAALVGNPVAYLATKQEDIPKVKAAAAALAAASGGAAPPPVEAAAAPAAGRSKSPMPLLLVLVLPPPSLLPLPPLLLGDFSHESHCIAFAAASATSRC